MVEVIEGSGWFVPTWVAVVALVCMAWWGGRLIGRNFFRRN